MILLWRLVTLTFKNQERIDRYWHEACEKAERIARMVEWEYKWNLAKKDVTIAEMDIAIAEIDIAIAKKALIIAQKT